MPDLISKGLRRLIVKEFAKTVDRLLDGEKPLTDRSAWKSSRYGTVFCPPNEDEPYLTVYVTTSRKHMDRIDGVLPEPKTDRHQWYSKDEVEA